MSLFTKLKTAIETEATSRTTVTSTRSLLAVMKAVDFNVFKFRAKTGVELIGPRGGVQQQRKLTDCKVIELEQGYKIHTFNITQLLNKLNKHYPVTLKNPQKVEFPTNIRVSPELVISTKSTKNQLAIPSEILSDLGIRQDEKGEYQANKDGYAGYITLNGELVPLRKARYANIAIKGSPSKKMIYRQFRDGNLEASFIKTLAEYIIATVVDNKGVSLIDIDIEPSSYVVKKELSEDSDETPNSVGSESLLSGVEFDSSDLFDSTQTKEIYKEVEKEGKKSYIESNMIILDTETEEGAKEIAKINEIVFTLKPNGVYRLEGEFYKIQLLYKVLTGDLDLEYSGLLLVEDVEGSTIVKPNVKDGRYVGVVFDLVSNSYSFTKAQSNNEDTIRELVSKETSYVSDDEKKMLEDSLFDIVALYDLEEDRIIERDSVERTIDNNILIEIPYLRGLSAALVNLKRSLKSQGWNVIMIDGILGTEEVNGLTDYCTQHELRYNYRNGEFKILVNEGHENQLTELFEGMVKRV